MKIAMLKLGKGGVSLESARRSIPDLLEPLEQIASNSPNLSSNCAATFRVGDHHYELPRYVFLGPRGGGDLIRIGIFALIRGDEPEGAFGLIQFVKLLEQSPDLARGYCLFFYPVCNPTGYEDSTGHSRHGGDISRQFWRESSAAESRLLESELSTHHFHGIISLHSDSSIEAMRGTTRGGTLARHLVEPALDAAAAILPVRSLIAPLQPGTLRAPPNVKPEPFQICLRTPKAAPQYVQYEALAIALQAILAEYRKLISFAQHL